MSKRFGRNQKRKMKAELASLQEARERELQLLRHQSSKLECYRDTIGNVRRVLGEHFAALPPQRRTVQGAIDHYRINVFNNESVMDFDPREAAVQCREIDLAIDTLRAFWLELQGDNLRYQTLLNLQSPGGDIGYAVSESALLRTPPKILAKHATEGIREHLEQYFSARQKTRVD